MRDIIEKYGISRDVIKYYEKKGLITPVRSEGGYRLYDDKTIVKLEMLLHFREFGLQASDLEFMQNRVEYEDSMQFLQDYSNKLKKQMQDIQNRLEEIEEYQDQMRQMQAYCNQFKICNQFQFCKGCSCIAKEKKNNFYVQGISIVSVSEDGIMQEMQEVDGIVRDSSRILNEVCRNCQDSEHKIYFEKVYRGIYALEGIEKLGQLIRETYASAKEKGYQFQKEVYVFHNILTDESKGKIWLDIVIPFHQKNKMGA